MLKKVSKGIIISAAPFISYIILPAVALAAINSGNLVPGEIQNIDNIVSVVRAVIRFILVVAFVLAFIMLLIGGIRWITAGGDEKAVSSARNMITAALIGLVVVLVAFAIIRLVELFFKVNIITGGVNIPQVGD